MSAKMALISSQLLLNPANAVAEQDYRPFNTISMPAYTVINDALKSAFPLVNGKENKPLMRLICDLARGVKRQDEINFILTKNNVNISSIPASGNPLSLLVNRDSKHQQKACASWLAISLHNKMNLDAYKIKKTKDTDNNKSKTWSFWPLMNQSNKQEPSVTIEWDKARFNELAIDQMAVAKSTAQFYSLIANDLQQKSEYSFSELKKNLDTSIASYAAQYLNAIKINAEALQSAGIEVSELTSSGYKITDNQGTSLSKESDGFLLAYQQIPWLGDGKIMGKDYYITVNLASDAKVTTIPAN